MDFHNEPNTQMAEDKFTQLLSRKLSGEISPDELDEFNKLIESDPSLQAEYQSIRSYWQENNEVTENIVEIFDRIKQQAGIEDLSEGNIKRIQADREKTSKKAIWWRGIAAAAVTIIATAAFYHYYFKGRTATEDKLMMTVATIHGAIKTVHLPDGTRVTLNSMSNFRFPERFKGLTRDVYLDGEAFFDVKKDQHHPFIVHTKESNIRVLGTAFDIKCYFNDGLFEATLFRGIIQASINSQPNKTFTLKPADKLTITPSGALLTRQAFLDNSNAVSIDTAWMNGKLAFKDTPFILLTNSLQRKYGVKFFFKKNNLKYIKLTGDFENEDINQILQSIQVVTKFSFTHSGNYIYIF